MDPVDPFKKWIHLAAWKKIIVALMLGVFSGLAFGESTVILKPIGNIFINAIHMIIVPVVFTVIVCAVLSMEDFSKMRRISLRAVLLYSFCMAIAALIGIVVATFIAPGVGFPIVQDINSVGDVNQIKEIPTIMTMLEGIVPKSPVGAFVEGNVLQIVVFSILFGLSINLAGDTAKPIANLFKSMSVVVFKLASIVMSFAPYGIFAFIAWTFGMFGLNAFLPLIKFVVSVFLACFIQMLFVYALTLWVVVGDKPNIFIRKIIHPLMFAFTTCSSAATLPLSIECTRKHWQVPETIADFLLPLGASFNLNGLSIYLSVATIFAANIYGIDLLLSDYIILVFTIIFTCMGIAAVPGSAIIVMSVVMTSVGVPLGALGIIIGVDRLNDMLQTATNVAGDIYATVMIAHFEEKELTLDENLPEKVK